jgi:hypothetical protein
MLEAIWNVMVTSSIGLGSYWWVKLSVCDHPWTRNCIELGGNLGSEGEWLPQASSCNERIKNKEHFEIAHIEPYTESSTMYQKLTITTFKV